MSETPTGSPPASPWSLLSRPLAAANLAVIGLSLGAYTFILQYLPEGPIPLTIPGSPSTHSDLRDLGVLWLPQLVLATLPILAALEGRNAPAWHTLAAEEYALRARVRERRIRLTEWSSLSSSLALGLMWIGLAALHLPSGRWFAPYLVPTVLTTLTVGLVAPATALLPEQVRALNALERLTHPDEPNHWWAGLLYINRADPQLLVRKRESKRYTLNLGQARAWAILGLLLSLPGLIAALMTVCASL